MGKKVYAYDLKVQVHEVLSGFRLLKKEVIKEVEGVFYEFEHVKTGAKLIYLSNKDDNKVFSISFKTPISDNTGVPHILEHSLLCGSKKYPLKEPFVELMKGSLQTFLNAMTASEHTIYPIASRNEKDFLNLMDVYLDAVFNPLLVQDPLILKQEGWRFEIHPKTGELMYNGVVYNEMKGMFSNPESVLHRLSRQTLYPRSTYQYESGGDPEYIPQLTQEMFVAFYKKFYHPSNSYIYLYGDGNIEAHLSMIDSQYLSQYEKVKISTSIEKDSPFEKPVLREEYYSVDPQDSTENKTFYAHAYSVETRGDEESTLGFSILNYILMSNSSSPLKRALLDAQLGQDAAGYFDDDLLQHNYTIIVRGSDDGKKQLLHEIIKKTLEKLVKKGIDTSVVDSSIQRFEFYLRENETGSYPKGLSYGNRILSQWIHDSDPIEKLQFEKYLARIKKKAKKRFFENLIEKYLLNNKHSSTIVLKPKPGLDQEKSIKLSEMLKKKKKEMSQEELKSIERIEADLKKKIAESDKLEDLKKIPLLALTDVNKDTEWTPIRIETLSVPFKKRLTEKSSKRPLSKRARNKSDSKLVSESDAKVETHVIEHEVFTNRISYVSMYFDLSTLTVDQLSLASFLSDVLSSLRTKKFNFYKLNTEINQYLGGLQFHVQNFVRKGSVNDVRSYFVVEGKVLTDQAPHLFRLLREILLNTQFTEYDRIKELLMESKTSMEHQVLSSGNKFSDIKSISSFSKWGQLRDRTEGLIYFDWLQQQATKLDQESLKELAHQLKNVSERVFQKNQMYISYTGSKQDIAVGWPIIKKFLKDFPQISFQDLQPWKLGESQDSYREAFVIPSKVQYVSLASDYNRTGMAHHGAMTVLKNILSKDFLWNKVRVQGGAYGAFVNLSRSGLMTFTSYRDPKLKETLDHFAQTLEYVSKFNVDEREMRKYILGTISGIDHPLSPVMKGQTSDLYYFSQVTREDLQRERNQILSSKVEDIRGLAPIIKNMVELKYYSVFGGEKSINNQPSLFTKVTKVIK